MLIIIVVVLTLSGLGLSRLRSILPDNDLLGSQVILHSEESFTLRLRVHNSVDQILTIPGDNHISDVSALHLAGEVAL